VGVVERGVNIGESAVNSEKSPAPVSKMDGEPETHEDVVETGVPDSVDRGFLDRSPEAQCEDELAAEFDTSESDVEHIFRPLRAPNDVTVQTHLDGLRWRSLLEVQLARRRGVAAIRGNGRDPSELRCFADAKGSEALVGLSAIGVSNWSYCSKCKRMCFVRVDEKGTIVGHRCSALLGRKSMKRRSKHKVKS
jgi:hypothetical protein